MLHSLRFLFVTHARKVLFSPEAVQVFREPSMSGEDLHKYFNLSNLTHNLARRQSIRKKELGHGRLFLSCICGSILRQLPGEHAPWKMKLDIYRKSTTLLSAAALANASSKDNAAPPYLGFCYHLWDTHRLYVMLINLLLIFQAGKLQFYALSQMGELT